MGNAVPKSQTYSFKGISEKVGIDVIKFIMLKLNHYEIINYGLTCQTEYSSVIINLELWKYLLEKSDLKYDNSTIMTDDNLFGFYGFLDLCKSDLLNIISSDNINLFEYFHTKYHINVDEILSICIKNDHPRIFDHVLSTKIDKQLLNDIEFQSKIKEEFQNNLPKSKRCHFIFSETCNYNNNEIKMNKTTFKYIIFFLRNGYLN